MSPESSLRRHIVEIGRCVYERGLAAGTDGNISARLDARHILITASGCALGRFDSDDVVRVGVDEPSREPAPGGPSPDTPHADPRAAQPRTRQPSSELAMHLEVYTRRPDVGAAVHAHPPSTIACTLADVDLSEPIIPEPVLAFGRIGLASYATPSTEEGAREIRELIGDHDVLVLDRHGALTVGRDLNDAFCKLEQLEHCARIMLAARALGRPQPLPAHEVGRLTDMYRRSRLE